jgi:hypothetical protein
VRDEDTPIDGRTFVAVVVDGGGYLIPVTERDVGQLSRACVLQVGHMPIKRRSFKRRVLRIELLRASRIVVVRGEWWRTEVASE